MMSICRDISDRKKAEEALRESEERLRTVLETVEEGIILTDENGLFYLYNNAMTQLTGYSREEADKSKDFMRLLYPGETEYQLAAQNLAVLLREGRSQELETAIRRKDGQTRDILAYSVTIFHEGRKMFLTTFRDITEHKEAEKQAVEMASVKAAMEVTVKKSAEIAEAYNELKRTKDVLIQSEKLSAIGTLSAGVAHELNNPLTGVLGIARSYMEDKDPASRDYRDLQEMVKAGERMAKIIRGMLDFSRPSTGEKEDVSCNALIETVLDFSKKIMISHQVDVQKDFEKDLPLIKVDGNQIRQVIINLVDNACDAMKNKGVLRIATRSLMVNGARFVEMEFTDSGHGIKQEDITKIFDPFFTTKRPGKGTGLGLAVVQSIIKQHGGEILVESPPAGQDTGTTFKVQLPVIFDVNGGG